jgi:UDP-2,3-diacylglucosamine pyrophosphatase LpxH
MEIDNSFDYSLILTFPNKEAHRYYQDDPTHLIFGDNTIKLLKKVQIYDSLTESI